MTELIFVTTRIGHSRVIPKAYLSPYYSLLSGAVT